MCVLCYGVVCTSLVADDVKTAEGQQKRGDDARQDEQQQHRQGRVLVELGAQREVCLVQRQEDGVLQGRLHTPGEVDHTLQTMDQPNVFPEEKERWWDGGGGVTGVN